MNRHHPWQHRLRRVVLGGCPGALIAAECWLPSETWGSFPGLGELIGFSRHKLQCHFPALLTLSISTPSAWYKRVPFPACPIGCISSSIPVAAPWASQLGFSRPCPTSLSLFPTSTLPISVLPSLTLSSNPNSATRLIRTGKSTRLM